MDFETPSSVPPNVSPAPSQGLAVPALEGSVTTGQMPIADLSYRNYNGPMQMRAARWWIIAQATMRSAFRSPVFWVGVGLCMLTYLAQGASLYFTMRMNKMGGPFASAAPQVKFARSFFAAQCGTMNSFGLLVIALLIGAGSIAADNRANALLVYLSKPITKGDYLLGKWVGLFLTMFLVTLLPALLFYVYCALSYAGDGFFATDKLLIGRLLLAAAIPPLLHSSVLLGFSAWSKSPSMAGAIYAGLYLVGGIIVSILGGLMTQHNADNPARGLLVQHLSLSGVIDGLVQNIYRVDLPNVFRIRRMHEMVSDAPPSLSALLLIGGVLIVLGVLAARARIQAVEVIRG